MKEKESACFIYTRFDRGYLSNFSLTLSILSCDREDQSLFLTMPTSISTIDKRSESDEVDLIEALRHSI